MAAKVKQAEGYQVKQVLAEKSGELNAFGWNKVKNSTRVIKKKTYVNVRRKTPLAKIPGLKAIESKYEKWSKKKIRRNPLGGIFAFLFMIVFLAIAVVGLYIGLNDNVIGGKAYEKSIAVYNMAVKNGLIDKEGLKVDKDLELCEYDAETKTVKVADGYSAFIKKGYVAYSFAAFINNYTYLDDEDKAVKYDAKDDADLISKFAKDYLTQLDELGFVSYAEDAEEADIEKAKLAYDATVSYSADDDLYSAKAGGIAAIDGIVDGMLRPTLQGFVDYKPLLDLGVIALGIPLIAGAAGIILFIICLIGFIRVCTAKNRRMKRDEIVAECLKEGSALVYGVKVKNRDLMTKTERKMHDMQSMIVRAIHQANEDDDDDD